MNIYKKIFKIQSEVKDLIKNEENKEFNFNFFNELQVLSILKPLLIKYGLIILISDDSTSEFKREKAENGQYSISYLKKMEIIDSESPENIVTFKFWACGSNMDLAKAKGASETYSIKYILSKFFLIPVKEEIDPDKSNSSMMNNYSKINSNRELNSNQDDLLSEEKQQIDFLLKKGGWKK